MILKSESTLPTSTVEHNKKLDDLALKQEPIDRDAPWWQRKFFATTWSTIASAVRALRH
jgi:hypothetical protein